MQKVRDKIKETLDLRAKATKGEWVAENEAIHNTATGNYLAEIYGGNVYEDAKLISHAANAIELYAKALDVALDELDNLGNKRESCKHYECCANCGEIYSAQEAIEKIARIFGEGE